MASCHHRVLFLAITHSPQSLPKILFYTPLHLGRLQHLSMASVAEHPARDLCQAGQFGAQFDFTAVLFEWGDTLALVPLPLRNHPGGPASKANAYFEALRIRCISSHTVAAARIVLLVVACIALKACVVYFQTAQTLQRKGAKVSTRSMLTTDQNPG